MGENLCFIHYNHLFPGLISWDYPFNKFHNVSLRTNHSQDERVLDRGRQHLPSTYDLLISLSVGEVSLNSQQAAKNSHAWEGNVTWLNYKSFLVTCLEISFQKHWSARRHEKLIVERLNSDSNVKNMYSTHTQWGRVTFET